MKRNPKHKHRGFMCQAGLWNPQIQFQITPLCWGISGSYSRTKVAGQLGPVAMAIWFVPGRFIAECRSFTDPNI